MTTTRPFVADDLFRMATTNLDPLTETYNLGFYLLYLTRWPGMCSAQESPQARLSSYMIGKAEGVGREWHGHVSALTVAPEFRRLGLAKTLMAELERVSDKVCVVERGGFACTLFHPPDFFCFALTHTAHARTHTQTAATGATLWTCMCARGTRWRCACTARWATLCSAGCWATMGGAAGMRRRTQWT